MIKKKCLKNALKSMRKHLKLSFSKFQRAKLKNNVISRHKIFNKKNNKITDI